jgi:hypothetical protein
MFINKKGIKMNQHQINYTMKRIDELRYSKIKQAELKFIVAAKILSNNEKYELIDSKKVKLKSKVDFGKQNKFTNDYLSYFYDFSKFENDQYLSKDGETLIEQIKKLAQESKDQVMLGDCDEALKLIKELEAVKI